MFFRKKYPAPLSDYLKGDPDLLRKAAEREEPWTTRGGLTPRQLVDYLHLNELPPYEIPVYTRNEGKLRFITETEFENIFHVSHTPQLLFDSFTTLDDIAWRTKNQKTRKETDLKNKWTHALLMKQREKSGIPPGAIKWINPELGYGVFAYKDLAEYTYVGEYTGIVRKRAPNKDRFNNYVFRYVTGTKNAPYVIDAREHGGFTRFINHSDCPNLTSRWIIIGGITHIIFFTNQFIKRGTQLTYDYGEHYWRSRRFPRLL